MRTLASLIVLGVPLVVGVLVVTLPLEQAAYLFGAALPLFYALHKFGGWADRRWPAQS